MDSSEPGQEYNADKPEEAPPGFIDLDKPRFTLEGRRERLESETGTSTSGQPVRRAGSSLTPEGLIADQSLAQAIRDQALLLPPLYQKVLDLYYFKGKRLGEIAKTCERSEDEIARIHAQCALAVQLAMKHYRPR